MRSLVFLPPPHLSHFPGTSIRLTIPPHPSVHTPAPPPTRSTRAADDDIEVSTASVDIYLPQPTSVTLGREQGEEEEEDVDFIPDSIEPHILLLSGGGESVALSEVAARLEEVQDSVDPHESLLREAGEESLPVSEVLEGVPDSVDPHIPLESVEEGSLARSIVDDAPQGVPWELLHPKEKRRVRIKSPILAIETPERLPTRKQAVVVRGEEEDVDRSRFEVGDEEAADGSRIVIGQDSDEEELPAAASTQSRSMERNPRLRKTGCRDEQQATSAGDGRSKVRGDLTMEAGGEISLAAGLSVECFPPLARPPLFDSRPLEDSSLDESNQHLTSAEASPSSLQVRPPIPAAEEETQPSLDETSISASASSLAIRPPIPAAPAAGASTSICRFTFFSSKPSSRRSLVPPDVTVQEPSSIPTLSPPPPPLPAPLLAQDGGLHSTLPTMNDFGASLIADPSAESSTFLAGESILPPPTLHFTLSSITPLSRILAHPAQYLSSPNLLSARNTPGGASTKVNLLVVIKDIGEVMRVRNKFHAPQPPPTRSEVRGVSSAFAAALREERVGDGKTERLELIVLEGTMSPTKRLRETDSGAWEAVEEVASKHLFKVVLWGALARQCTSDSTDEPNAVGLRPGDVIHLQNISLSRASTTPYSPVKRPRLGTGFPRGGREEKVVLVGQANPSQGSKVELCYRSHVVTRQDGEGNFDKDIAAFDLRRRRLLELSRVWSAGEGLYE